MIFEITSRQNSKIKDLAKLRNDKNSKDFVFEGFHMLEMAVEKGLVKEIYSLKKINNLPNSISQYIVTKEIMEKISLMKSPQGVVVVASKPSYSDDFGGRVLYLDGISDPGNLGTILRTALAFGYKDVILSKDCCSLYNDKVIQSTQGSIFSLNIVTDNEQIIEQLKHKNYKIFATEIKGSVSLNSIEKFNKHVLVLGNEAHGVSNKLLEQSDLRVRIDIENIESLNVGVAAGICMHFLTKK